MTGLPDWIGQRVAVNCAIKPGEFGRFEATLEAADEQGIILKYSSKDSTHTRFYPWHAVGYVHLITQEEEKRRRAGFSSSQEA